LTENKVFCLLVRKRTLLLTLLQKSGYMSPLGFAVGAPASKKWILR